MNLRSNILRFHLLLDPEIVVELLAAIVVVPSAYPVPVYMALTLTREF